MCGWSKINPWQWVHLATWPMLHNWLTQITGIISCLLDGVCNKYLAANWKKYPMMQQQQISSIIIYVALKLMSISIKPQILLNVLGVSLNKTFLAFTPSSKILTNLRKPNRFLNQHLWQALSYWSDHQPQSVVTTTLHWNMILKYGYDQHAGPRG